MNYVPPLSMWLYVEKPQHRPWRLWLPLFLVWLILLPLMLLVLLLAVVVDVVLFAIGEPYHHYSLLLVRALAALADTRGSVIRVRTKDAVVDMTIQ